MMCGHRILATNYYPTVNTLTENYNISLSHSKCQLSSVNSSNKMITATVSILILKHYNYLCETLAVPTLTWMHVEQEFFKVH